MSSYTNIERRKATNREWYKRNKDKRLAYNRQYRVQNRDKVRLWTRCNRYNLTKEEVLNLLSTPFCMICKTLFKAQKEQHIDHCHTTGKVRGVLCNDCNSGLGRFKDSPELLVSALKYIAGPKEQSHGV